MIIIVLAAAGPLLVMVVYSFLTPGDYGIEMGVFHAGLGQHDPAARYFRRHADVGRRASVDLLAQPVAVVNHNSHGLCLRIADGLVHRHAAARQTRILAIPGDRSILVQPSGAHHCYSGADPRGGCHQQLAVAAGHYRRTAADDVHQFRDRVWHDLCLPASDGVADLCRRRQAGLPVGGGRTRPLCQPLAYLLARDPSFDQTGYHCRVNPCLYSVAGGLCDTSRAGWRRT